MSCFLLVSALLAFEGAAQGLGPVAPPPAEAPFLAASAAAMNRMMQDMTARPTGDVDADFVDMMQPHHQGAIEMAELELRYGRNEQIRRIAQEVIVDQQQEIAAMSLALGRPLPRPAPAPTQGGEPGGVAPSAETTPARAAAAKERQQ